MSENKKSIDGWHPVIFFGKKNLNGRVYTEDSINEEAMTNMKKKINDKTAYGELGHAESSIEVHMNNISHAIEDVVVKNDIMFAKIKSISTLAGDKLKVLTELDSESIVFRPRTIGNVNEDGIVSIKKLISFDAVNAMDDSFKEMQDMYNDMLRDDLGRDTKYKPE